MSFVNLEENFIHLL